MKVELRRLVDIFPYKQNARKIPQRAIDKVALSLKEFGWQQPIVIDKKGVIVAGHTRWLAAQQLGWTVAPVHVADKLTAHQIRQYRLMDNRSHGTCFDECCLDLAKLAVLDGRKTAASGSGLTG